jgi:hypothetical protein
VVKNIKSATRLKHALRRYAVVRRAPAARLGGPGAHLTHQGRRQHVRLPDQVDAAGQVRAIGALHVGRGGGQGDGERVLSASTKGRLRGREARWRIARGEPRPEANGGDSLRGGQLATTEGTPRARHIAAGGEPRLESEWPGEKGQRHGASSPQRGTDSDNLRSTPLRLGGVRVGGGRGSQDLACIRPS